MSAIRKGLRSPRLFSTQWRMTDARRSAFFADLSPPRYFSIDAGRPFLADLAQGLIDAFGEAAAEAEIFLPTRRAVRAAPEIFLDVMAANGRRAALFPRFRTIGDIDEDEAVALGEAADEIALPPAIAPMDRLVALARLVARRDRVFAGQENWPAAISAARELGGLLDSFHAEEIDPSALTRLDVADIAGHWRRSLDFLDIITRAWPAHLAEIGRMDGAARRARLIGLTAERLRDHPPGHPVIIAGTTASAPAVARLIAAIARAPSGAAILPGLDRSLDARAAGAIDDAHPQFGLKSLLATIGLGAGDVRPWPGSGGDNPRSTLLTLALRPAEATDDWLSLVAAATARDDGLASATEGLTLIEAETEEAESAAVAALLRETVETPGKTAMLVTPDRLLARRVALKLRRWGLDVADSAGAPFANTPCGVFLRLVALYLEDPADPVAILALLRHPLTATDAKGADGLDRALRGLRPARGLASVREKLAEDGALTPAMEAAMTTLDTAAAAFPREGHAPFAAMLAGHIAAAELIAGPERLWSGADGAKGAGLLADLADAGSAIDAVGGRRYTDVFTALIGGVAVYGLRRGHPRLSILGPLEARLISADRIILGGLNEGVWPSDAAGDPFLSRPMRRDLGLPSPERRIGLAAHDFANLAAQGDVFLTRAKRSGGKPANPSRWIVRLRNILTGAKALPRVDRSAHWSAILTALDAPPAVAPASPPAPRAGPGRRPGSMSVTQIEKWLRDPYGIYARHLLGLKKLEEPGAAFGMREMGSLLHRVFEYAAQAPSPPTRASLIALLDSAAPAFGFDGAERRFWSVALDDAFDWFAAFEAERRAAGASTFVERDGRWTLPGVAPAFTLTARADRIDIEPDGAALLFDYKSGKLRTENQDRTFSPQLALTAAMLAAGAFPDVGARAVSRYGYLRVVNRSANEKENSWGREGADAAEAAGAAARALRALVAAFDDPGTRYLSQPHPEFVDDYGDYDQLARRKEWSAEAESDGAGE
ncbi:MAG: double-strand break repair protein AddB [Parvularculaceae bacterium]|nr:double-strand break repair protein AddB [Parvularculaceae bacterium]